MNPTQDARHALRQSLRKRRAALDPAAQAAAADGIAEQLSKVRALEHASPVAGYHAIRGEINIDRTLRLLADQGAVVTVPRVTDNDLEFLPWVPGGRVEEGSFGIPEPTDGVPVAFADHAVILTPLVAFDASGARLGQGGGFYDRAIAAAGAGRPRLIGVAHHFQQVDEVPTEAWDQQLDAVVTDQDAFEFVAGTLNPFAGPTE